jgi:membrane protein
MAFRLRFESLRISLAPRVVGLVEVDSRAAWALVKEACIAWMDDDVPSLGAALAFYTIFSLAPVLIITTAIAGLVFGRQAVQREILGQMQSLIGSNGTDVIRVVIQSADAPGSRMLASAIGILAVLAGASGAFLELQDALNKIWRAQLKSQNFWLCAIRKRCSSFGLVLATGFLLVVSLALSAGLEAVGKFMGHLLPDAAFVLYESINFLVSAAAITLLFAMIYKVLPDTEIAWSDVWIGAAVTSFLVTTGKLLIGLYLGRSTLASAYGAAGSLVILLVWVYYSAQLLLFGAEFTHAYARKRGSRAASAAPSQAEGMESTFVH